MSNKKHSTPDKIVFFDGVCVLCNSFVDFIIHRDHRQKLLFAPLQGETAKKYIINTNDSKLKSVVFMDHGVLYYKSTAAIKIFMALGGLWKLTAILFIFPAFIRNLAYNFIASKRYRWFGEKESCRIPSSQAKEQFLH